MIEVVRKTSEVYLKKVFIPTEIMLTILFPEWKKKQEVNPNAQGFFLWLSIMLYYAKKIMQQ